MYLVKRPVFASAINYLRRSVASTQVAEKLNVSDNIPLKSWKEIPGPASLPVLGNLLNFLPGGEFHGTTGVDLTNKLYSTYGPIVRLDGFIGMSPLIMIADPEAVSQILRAENRYPKRPGFKSLDYYRRHVKKDRKEKQLTGLITDHEEPWKELRSAVNPIFLQPKTIKLYTSVIDQVAKDMITRMISLRDDKNMLKGQFDNELNLWSLESIAVVALGCRLGCLDINLPEDSPARQLIHCVQELFILAQKLDFSPSIWKLVATPEYKRAMKLMEAHETISKRFIKQAMEEMETKGKSEDEKGILEKLLEINEDYAHIMATDLLFGGVDTASNVMAATLYLLAVNPEKQAKLREELRSGEEKRPYLKACLKEASRMMPAVAGNARITTKEHNLLGYKIPANMQVVFGHQNMSLMERHFPRVKEFIPERWLVDKDDPLSYKNTHPFVHSVFGFGVRSCLGRRIAELETETFTARVVENFQIEWFGPPPKVEQSSLNYVRGPFNFVFKDAPK